MEAEENGRDFIQKRLYFYHFLNDGITYIIPTLMASFYIIFKLNWFEVGLIFSFNLLGTICFQLIIGYYTDKEFSEGLMKIGLFLLAMSSFLLIFSFDFISLLIFATLIGIALAFQHTIAYATTSRLYPEQKDVMIGKQGAAGDVGKCLAIFSSAFIVLFFNWQLVVIMWSLMIFITFIVVMYNFKHIKFHDYYKKVENEEQEKQEILVFHNEKPTNLIVLLILISWVLYCAIFSLLIVNSATYLRVEREGLVSIYSGFILGFAIFFGVIGAYFSGSVKNKYGMDNSMIFFSVLLIVFISLYLILDTSNLVLTLVFYALFGFILCLIYPQLLAEINRFYHSKKIGLGFGFALTLGWLGNFLGSLIGGYYAELYSPIMFFWLSTIGLILIIFCGIIIKIKEKTCE